MEFLSLSHRRSSARNVPIGEERGETDVFAGYSRRCTTATATWNFLISRARFMEQVNTAQEFSFSFSKLRYGPFGFNPEKFANIWQIKSNWIRSMKFETLRIHFSMTFSARGGGELSYERGGDACRLAQGCKFQILVSLREFWPKHHYI